MQCSAQRRTLIWGRKSIPTDRDQSRLALI